jgi:hypothetical protein
VSGQSAAASDQKLAEALQAEAVIADEAVKIREEAEDGTLTVALFGQLYPLLCKPIPSGFIQTVGNIPGKPYESTGIRSVQVQVDRMNNVLTPAWWWYEEAFEEGGKLAIVTVFVGEQLDPEKAIVKRSSRGGVTQGTGSGNIHKGSFTNAAKLAIARVGPGHEVYVGAADLDPDVNEAVAKQTGSGGISKTGATNLANRAFAVPDARDNLALALGHITEAEIGDCSTVAKAAAVLADLRLDQAEKLDSWLHRKEEEAGIDGAALSPRRVDQILEGFDIAGDELGGVTPLDGLNLLLGSLGVDGFDPNTDLREQMAGLNEATADALDAAFQRAVESDAEEVDGEVVEGGGADA